VCGERCGSHDVEFCKMNWRRSRQCASWVERLSLLIKLELVGTTWARHERSEALFQPRACRRITGYIHPRRDLPPPQRHSASQPPFSSRTKWQSCKASPPLGNSLATLLAVAEPWYGTFGRKGPMAGLQRGDGVLPEPGRQHSVRSEFYTS